MNKHLLTAALAAAAAALVPAAAAPATTHAAGTYTQFLCADPDSGEPTGAAPDGLTGITSTTDWYAGPGDGCAVIEPRIPAPQPPGRYAALHYEVTDPALTIVAAEHYSAVTADSSTYTPNVTVRQHASTQYGDAAALPAGSDVATPGGLNRGLPGNRFAQVNHFTTVLDAQHRQFTASVICTPASGETWCSQDQTTWRYLFLAGRILLRDAAAPTVIAADGSLKTAASLRSTGVITLDAGDQGSGLYRWRLYSGAQLVDDGELDQATECRDLNPINDDPYEFAAQHPCAATVRNTQIIASVWELPEGPQPIRMVIEDAAGNEATVVDRTVTIDNHPAPALTYPDQGPAITGAPKVGDTLVGDGGWWHDASTYTYAWERCTVAGACSTIAGATAYTYTATAADLGSHLRFAVTAANTAGETHTERSAMTAAVPDPPGPAPASPAPPPPSATDRTPTPTPPGAPSPSATNLLSGPLDASTPLSPAVPARLTVTLGRHPSARVRYSSTTTAGGRLLTSAGAPIPGATITATETDARPGAPARALGTATTSDAGRFTYRLGHGPSRFVTFTYNLATKATVRLIVPAQLTLRIGRARTGRTTWLTGRLAHLGRAGIKLDVQALDGRRWRTFDTTKTKKNGAYRYGYRFKRTAAGRRFALRVLVDTPTYPFAVGASKAVTVFVAR